MDQDFREALGSRVLLCDGAMGTMLYAKGFRMTRCFDELNLTHPDVVREVHDAYVAADVDIIETNTYGANRLKLAPHGLGDQVEEINRRGVELAREAAGKVARFRRVFVAGSVGPPGRPLQQRIYLTPDEIREAFLEQVTVLVEAGVDLLIIETQSNLEEARQAVMAARTASPDIPVLACVTFGEDGETLQGHTPEQAVAALEPLGIDAIGANCSVGPADLLPILERMRKVTELPLVAQPNAGTPRMIEGRFFYVTSPEYMAKAARRFISDAGVAVVGGCCGTTPEHIRAVAESVKSVQRASKGGRIEIPEYTPAPKSKAETVPTSEKSPLAARLQTKGSFTVSVELRPPRGLDVSRILQRTRALKDAGVHAVNLPDGALASARVSPLSLARILENEVGIETIVHWCCRDRNLLGMQADLLGAQILGQMNILAVTGDPPRLGDYPSATAVFDVDAIGLVRMMNRLNHGEDVIGKPIGPPARIHIGVGVDPSALDQAEEERRFRLKVESGAEFVMTQPVFDVEQVADFLGRVRDVTPPVMVGILPLTSYRNAEFYRNEIPGMHIPDAILSRMEQAGDDDAALEEGIRIAQEALLTMKDLPGVRGAYIMPPFGRAKMAIRVLECLS